MAVKTDGKVIKVNGGTHREDSRAKTDIFERMDSDTEPF